MKWKQEWRNRYWLSKSIVVGLELPNLRDPVELNVTLPWALGIFQILTLTALGLQTTHSLSPIGVWAGVGIAVRWPETCWVLVCLWALVCVDLVVVDWLYVYHTSTTENIFMVVDKFGFKDWSIFQPKCK